jgi:hypothetical protein
MRIAIGDMVNIQHGTIQFTPAHGTPMAISVVLAGPKWLNTVIVLGHYLKLDLPLLAPTVL